MNDLAAHLRAQEERLFEPSVRASKTALTQLLAPEFREIGSSGKLHTFSEITDALSGEMPVLSRSLADFQLQTLSEQIALVTYRAIRKLLDGREIVTLRSSIWRCDASGQWRMVFHQGTLTT